MKAGAWSAKTPVNLAWGFVGERSGGTKSHENSFLFSLTPMLSIYQAPNWRLSKTSKKSIDLENLLSHADSVAIE